MKRTRKPKRNDSTIERLNEKIESYSYHLGDAVNLLDHPDPRVRMAGRFETRWASRWLYLVSLGMESIFGPQQQVSICLASHVSFLCGSNFSSSKVKTKRGKQPKEGVLRTSPAG